MAIRHPLTAKAVLSPVEGTAPLPMGWLDVQAVMDGQNGRLEAQQLTLDGAVPLSDTYIVIGDELYVDPSHGSVTLYYTTSYPKLQADEDVVPLPNGLEEALLYYVASRALSQRAATSGFVARVAAVEGAARLRRWSPHDGASRGVSGSGRQGRNSWGALISRRAVRGLTPSRPNR